MIRNPTPLSPIPSSWIEATTTNLQRTPDRVCAQNSPMMKAAPGSRAAHGSRRAAPGEAPRRQRVALLARDANRCHEGRGDQIDASADGEQQADIGSEQVPPSAGPASVPRFSVVMVAPPAATAPPACRQSDGRSAHRTAARWLPPWRGWLRACRRGRRANRSSLPVPRRRPSQPSWRTAPTNALPAVTVADHGRERPENR